MNKDLKIDCKSLAYKHRVIEIVSDSPTNYSPVTYVENITLSNTKHHNFKNVNPKKNTKGLQSKLSKYT